MVPVIVRDHSGKAIGTLQQQDFSLFDKGKQQVISKFSVEKAGGRTAIELTAPPEEEGTNKPPVQATAVIANRFVAYLFDDINSNLTDLALAREAARKQIAESLQPTDRIAIFSMSGRTTLHFTDDRRAIDQALLQLQPRIRARSSQDCPDISDYMAFLISNGDGAALGTAIQDAMVCQSIPANMAASAAAIARAKASEVTSQLDYDTRLALSGLKATIRRIAVMPGERVVVLVSSGFVLLLEHRSEETEVVDTAIKSNVTINSLDARGLEAMPGFDVSRGPVSVQTAVSKSRYAYQDAQAKADVLGELAEGTGGTWFHNRNDLAQGFRMIAAAPEYTYVLGFAPQNLRYDGSYHQLKVSLKTSSGLTLQARRGYYAPKKQLDAAEQAKEEVREALFSREELKAIPVGLQTQFFKPSDISAKLSVLAHVDLRAIQFRKTDGRNRNSLTVVSGIFDRNGILIKAVEKNIDMFLKDETFAAHMAAGLTIKTSFDVTPGNYVIRLVVRDGEGQMMTAQNGVVQIP